MSKQGLETSKEWTNIDYTNTGGYKTVKAYNKDAGVYHCPHELNAPASPGIPDKEFFQLKYLRILDGKIRKDKGPIFKKITNMHRKIVHEFDEYGKKVTREYLFFGGEFRGTTFNGEEDARSFEEGRYRKPLIGKIYTSGKKFDAETGEDLGEMRITGSKLVYYYEVPKSKQERIKYIHSFIENSNGTYAENILYYFDIADDDPSARSDPTFSYKDFTELSIEELKDLSFKGGGELTPGYYRGPDNKLRNKEGIIVDS